MTAVDDIRDLGAMRSASERAFRDEKADHAADVEELREWKDRALTAEQELRDLLADVEASTQVDLLERYRRVCVERSVLVGQLATARAQAEALKGNR